LWGVLGTLYDWSQVESCLEIAVGLSCCKSVLSSTFPDEWDNNKESLYKHLENAHLGIKGLAMKDGKPLQNNIDIVGGTGGIINERGEYWILKLPGEYEAYSLE